MWDGTDGKYRPGNVLWVYTPLGEGFYKVWFRGKMYEEALEFMSGPYDAPRKLDRELRCKLTAKGAAMNKQQRTTYSTEFKVKVVLEAFKGQRTIDRKSVV